jgi:hypothetical protein
MDIIYAINYLVKIDETSAYFNSSFFEDHTKNCSEMIITSKPFYDFDACKNSLTRLMTELGSKESSATGKNHVIVSKINPRIQSSEVNAEDKDVWDKSTLAKVYAADADQLKEAKLVSSIIGHITINHRITNALNKESAIVLQ